MTLRDHEGIQAGSETSRGGVESSCSDQEGTPCGNGVQAREGERADGDSWALPGMGQAHCWEARGCGSTDPSLWPVEGLGET